MIITINCKFTCTKLSFRCVLMPQQKKYPAKLGDLTG